MRALSLTILGLALAGPVPAAQGADSFWSRLYKALTTETAEKYASQGYSLRNVAAVRGAPLGQQDPAEPYWKGGPSAEGAKQAKLEREEFAAAVKLGLDGKLDESADALRAFQKNHPKSALLRDVKDALAQAAPPKAEAEAKKETGEAAPSGQVSPAEKPAEKAQEKAE